MDNDKNYCPENCRWITKGEQNLNKKNNVKILYPPMFITTFNNRPCILQSQEDFIKSNLECCLNKNVA